MEDAIQQSMHRSMLRFSTKSRQQHAANDRTKRAVAKIVNRRLLTMI